MSGGVVLNSQINNCIFMEAPYDNFFFQPVANDAGTSLGAALYVYHKYYKDERKNELGSLYLGPEFQRKRIESALIRHEVKFKFLNDNELISISARRISEGKILGWFQGRMEFGPRALGARSILADPRNGKMKDLLNEKIKFREGFRPYAPAVLEEYAERYFKGLLPSPFMIVNHRVREDRKGEIPAVVHVDGTARVQTVNEKQNKIFYDLINKFHDLTGIPVILNTSFNIRGEPIVCYPEQAVEMFLKTGMDCLAIGNFWVEK